MLSFKLKSISESCKLLLILIVMVVGMGKVKGQEVYANSAAIIAGGNVTNLSNATQSNETYATITGGSGFSKSSIQVLFSSPVPVKTTVYVKVNTAENVTVTAYSGNTLGSLGSLITLTSTTVFNSADNNYYIGIVSNSTFSSLKIEVTGSLLGSNSSNLFYAFYKTANPNDCGLGLATSVTSSGIALLGTNGVVNPYRAIDNDPNSFAHMSIGAIGLLASVNENVHFSTLSNAGDAVRATFSIPPSFVLSLSLLSNISVQAYNGNTPVGPRQGLNSLLTLDLLGLLNNGAKYTFYYAPPDVFDRIEFTVGGVLTIATELDLWDVQRVPSPLTVEGNPAGVINICAKNTVVNIKNPQTSTTYKWYDAPTGGTLLYTGSSFTINDILPESTKSYYIEASKPGCTNATRYQIQVKSQMPAITISNASPLCVGSTTTLTATSTIQGTWSVDFSNIATVSNTGLVTGKAAGTAIISYSVTDPATNCSNTAIRSITINPAPTFTSSTSAQVCTNSLFAYNASTNIGSNSTISWTRAIVTGISNPAASGTSSSISEVLVNTTETPKNVIYIFKVNNSGCSELTTSVTVTVNPKLNEPHINITSN